MSNIGYFDERTKMIFEGVEKGLIDAKYLANLARKLVYNENTRLFNSWDNTRFGDKHAKVNETKVYSTSFNVNSNNSYDTDFSCVNADCADVALDLINEG